MTELERSLMFLALALWAVLVLALGSGWPDRNGADRIPTHLPAVVCGSHGCQPTGANR